MMTPFPLFTSRQWSSAALTSRLQHALRLIRLCGGGLAPYGVEFHIHQGVVGRFGASPELSLPIHFGAWLFRPSALLNDTFYTQQQQLRAVPGQATAQDEPVHNIFNRRAIGGSLELRPPALAKVFGGEFLGRNFKHTIEPRIIYRYTNGVEKFSNIIRFDFRDILSNTNEVEFGLVQRLYMKRSHVDCAGGSTSGGDQVQPANAANAGLYRPAPMNSSPGKLKPSTSLIPVLAGQW